MSKTILRRVIFVCAKFAKNCKNIFKKLNCLNNNVLLIDLKSFIRKNIISLKKQICLKKTDSYIFIK